MLLSSKVKNTCGRISVKKKKRKKKLIFRYNWHVRRSYFTLLKKCDIFSWMPIHFLDHRFSYVRMRLNINFNSRTISSLQKFVISPNATTNFTELHQKSIQTQYNTSRNGVSFFLAISPPIKFQYLRLPTSISKKYLLLETCRSRHFCSFRTCA